MPEVKVVVGSKEFFINDHVLFDNLPATPGMLRNRVLDVTHEFSAKFNTPELREWANKGFSYVFTRLKTQNVLNGIIQEARNDIERVSVEGVTSTLVATINKWAILTMALCCILNRSDGLGSTVSFQIQATAFVNDLIPLIRKYGGSQASAKIGHLFSKVLGLLTLHGTHAMQHLRETWKRMGSSAQREAIKMVRDQTDGGQQENMEILALVRRDGDH